MHRTSTVPLAELSDVTKRYGPTEALKPLTLRIAAGRVTALLGPNGAGKTTAVRLLLGLTRPTTGTVRLFGTDPSSRAARQRTGVMLQVARVPDTLRVRELRPTWAPNSRPTRAPKLGWLEQTLIAF